MHIAENDDSEFTLLQGKITCHELTENYHAKRYFNNFQCSKEALQLGSRKREIKRDQKARSIG
jgi:hypothetical protein